MFKHIFCHTNSKTKQKIENNIPDKQKIENNIPDESWNCNKRRSLWIFSRQELLFLMKRNLWVRKQVLSHSRGDPMFYRKNVPNDRIDIGEKYGNEVESGVNVFLIYF